MDIHEYIKEASRTRNYDVEPLTSKKLELVNYCLGLAGEVGELINAFKKFIFHKHPENREKVVDELGDVFRYLIMIMLVVGVDIEEILSYNNNKIEKRYPNGFNSHASINRKE